MDKLEDLPAMPVPKLPAVVARGVRDGEQAKMLCGGCGAKVGGGVLRASLEASPARADIVSVAGDDAAILRQPGGGFQVLSTDHLRAFIEDPVQMTRIAAVHALGDVWAMGAQPQTALSSIILPRMSPALQARTLREIDSAARAVFEAAGAVVIGGHTTMGAELTIGFTVTGLRDTMPVTLAGAKAGDVLVLTRPVGAGVILAALMAGAARGAVVTDMLAQMEQPQQIAAQALAGAHAMTDVTGFGLIGHVQAICRASGVQAVITRDAVPVYAGARALSAAGHGSSLLAANIADAPTTGITDPLLHDPQTAGGLLAALPRAQAEQAVAQMRAQGVQAVIIGEVSAGTAPMQISVQIS
jgi:selenide,water dikinase